MRIITPAITEPITLAQARKQCKVDASGSPPTHEDDDLIAIFTSAAREWCEDELGRIVAPTLVETALSAFPAAEITLESAPASNVSITYYDEDSVLQIVDPSIYALDTTGQVAVVRLLADQTWPTTDASNDNVRVQYIVGYSAAGDSPQDYPLPARIKTAILLVLGHLYAHRQNTIEGNLTEIPFGACALLSPLKLRKGFA